MNVLVLLQCLLFFQEALCSVILFGGQYCRTDIGDGTHADPDDMITINCEVDNPNGGLNILTWSIPSQNVDIDHLNDVQGDTTSNDVNGVNYLSTVISSDNTEEITNASLTFVASSFLDEAVVICTNTENIMNNCTLFIKTSPSAPEVSSPNCTDITYQSLVLQWNPPSDNGGESISHYSITRTPGDIIVITDTTMGNFSDLTPNTMYTFNVSANNSLGFGEELSIKCNTPGEAPPGFTDVDICLDVDMNFNTVLDIKYSPCPIVIINTDTTPPVDNYTVEITDLSSVTITTDTCDYTIPVSEDNIYTVEMSVNNIIGSSEKTTADLFITSWLRDIEVMYLNDTSAVIQYTTADCVIPENLTIELNIDVNYSNINPSSVVSYESSTTDQFTVLRLEPNAVVMYTLQVISEVSEMFLTVGMSRTGSFTVTSTTTTMSSSTTTSVTTTNSLTSTTRSISSVTMTATSTPSDINTKCSGLSAPLSAGIAAVVTIPVSSIISSLLTLLVVYLCCGKNKGNYSINTTGPVYDTPFPGSNVTRTSEFEMKGNQAYGHVTGAPRSTSEYETVTS